MTMQVILIEIEPVSLTSFVGSAISGLGTLFHLMWCLNQMTKSNDVSKPNDCLNQMTLLDSYVFVYRCQTRARKAGTG